MTKTLCVMMTASLLLASPGRASDFTLASPSSKASSDEAAPCKALHATGAAHPVLHKAAASARTQRPAGPSSSMSPAMMLALALGMRNVSGPVVRTEPRMAMTSRPLKSLQREALLLPRDKDCVSSGFPAGSRVAMENKD